MFTYVYHTLHKDDKALAGERTSHPVDLGDVPVSKMGPLPATTLTYDGTCKKAMVNVIYPLVN